MKKIYYEKIGRRYVPVKEYDSDFADSYTHGTHLLMIYPGGQSRKYNIDPNYAALIAAARVASEAMVYAMHNASELKPRQTPVTEGQRKAWEALAKSFGDDRFTVSHPSLHDIAQAGVRAMQLEADKLLSNAAVRKAYEQFILLSKLTRNQK
jgi:hypothetical protein